MSRVAKQQLCLKAKMNLDCEQVTNPRLAKTNQNILADEYMEGLHRTIFSMNPLMNLWTKPMRGSCVKDWEEGELGRDAGEMHYWGLGSRKGRAISKQGLKKSYYTLQI
jgi:hypothetical protein